MELLLFGRETPDQDDVFKGLSAMVFGETG